MSRGLKQGAALLFLTGMAAVAALGLQGALTQLLLAVLLAYLFIPLVRRLETLRIKRKAAAISLVAFLLCVFLGTLAFLFVYLFREFRVFAKALPNSFALAMQKLQVVSDRFELGLHFDQQGLIPLIRESLSKLSPDVATSVVIYARRMFTSTTSIIVSILDLYLLPVFFFHIVADYEKIIDTVKALIPRPLLPTITAFCVSSDRIIRRYIRGQVFLALIRAVLYAIGLTLLRIDFGFLLGLLTGILSIIPFVGVSLGLVCSLVIVLATNAGLRVGIGVVVMFLTVGLVEGLWLRPKFIDKKSGLGELGIMLGLMVGGNLFGLPGIFLAVPVAAICRLIVLRLKADYQSSPYYLGAGNLSQAPVVILAVPLPQSPQEPATPPQAAPGTQGADTTGSPVSLP
jgi:predicted PurR-regulated permease PerM